MEKINNLIIWLLVSLLLLLCAPYIFITALLALYWAKAPNNKIFLFLWVTLLLVDLTLPQHLGIYTLSFSINSLLLILVKAKISLNKWYGSLTLITLAIVIEYVLQNILSQIAFKQPLYLSITITRAHIHKVLLTYLVLTLQSLYERYRT